MDDAVDDSAAFVADILMRFRNLGVTTAAEAAEVLKRHAAAYRSSNGEVAKVIDHGFAPPTVADVIRFAKTSVRLHNCLTKYPEVFSAWRADTALDDRQAFVSDICRRCANLGFTTASEAVNILVQYASAPWPLRAREPDVARDPACFDEMVCSVLGRSDLSTRLANLVNSGAFEGMLVRDIVIDRKRARQRLLEARNSGRKTAEEAIELVLGYVQQIQAGPAETSADAVPNKGDPDDPLFRRLLASLAPKAADRLRCMYATPREWCEEILRSVPEKDLGVLIERYGIQGAQQKTLQEIADGVHVTRECVRQVEARGLKRLGASVEARAALELLLAREGEAAWRTLSDGAAMIDAATISDQRRNLDPLLALAIDVLFKKIPAWLDSIGHRTPHGWFRSEADASRRARMRSELRALVRGGVTPLPLTTVESVLGYALDEADLEGDGWTNFEGYLHTGYLGAKARRAIRMHRLAGECSVDGLVDIGTLAHLYRERFPDEDCASRMFQMRMEEAPHLFAPLFDNIWLRLPLAGAPRRRAEVPYERRDIGFVDEFVSGSIGDKLAHRLVDAGPQKQVELREFMAAEDVSGSSTGSILLMNPCFRRVAPAVFALYRGDAELRERLRPRLLEERHCRNYCQSRHGGAPSGYFTAWGPEFERDLAAWAQASAPTELFRSLMSVIEPDAWSVSDEEHVRIDAVRIKEARWLLGAPRRPLGQRFMDAEQFFAILMHLSIFGWISWFAVNRVCGAKLDSYDAVDILAFLVMTGFVASPDQDWQGRHEATAHAVEAFERACARRHLHGELSWSDPEFAALLDGLAESSSDGARGWVDADEFAAALDAWRSGDLPTGKAYSGRQTRSIDVDDLFGSADWDAAFAG